MGILYLVATPIGNLEDLSPRALRILNTVDLIAAEDTRQTQKLLNHFKISKKTFSYHEHNKASKTPHLLSLLAEHDIALVSDAGMPAINDPGYEIVKAAADAGFTVCPIPGPSAPVTALSASAIPTDQFLYLGYLPRKATEREAQLTAVAGLPYTLIFLETPQRLLDALKDLVRVLGDRRMTAARELTKIHEEFVRGRISEVIGHFEAVEPLGEFTLIIEGASQETERWPAEKLMRDITARLVEGDSPSRLAQILSAASGWSRREIYKLITSVEAEE
jgi:16S rRNA (cytidine1402-2'-O)-methyltransferase